MNDIMRPIYLLQLIVSGGCGGFLWLLTCVPPKDSKSLIGQTQIMVQSDGSWKFHLSMVMAAGIFLFSLFRLLTAL